MKKHTFYILIMRHNKIQAIKQDGFTDGTYHYYKNEFKKWYAIEPTTGLSVINSRNTRKDCETAANAPEMLEKVKEKITKYMQIRFDKLVQEAQAEELKKNVPNMYFTFSAGNNCGIAQINEIKRRLKNVKISHC